VLAEPARAFLALAGVIPRLQAEADRRALQIASVVAFPGDKGQTFRAYSEALDAQAGVQRSAHAPEQTIKPGMPGVKEVEPGTIAAERAARAAKAEEVKRQWLERLGRKTD
jgi:hypothetical protein